MGEAAGSQVYGETMAQSGIDMGFINRSLFDALVEAAAAQPDYPALEDQERQPVTLRWLILASTVLGHRLVKGTRRRENVGLLLPNFTGVVVALFGLLAYDRTPALLNFTAGASNLEAMLAVGGIRRIVTARKFIAAAKLEAVIEQLAGKAEVIYLEDLRPKLGLFDKLAGAAYAKLPRLFHRFYRRQPDELAVVLFTSGTEGTPKGVALSSRNFLSNVAQILKLYTFVPDDTMFNAPSRPGLRPWWRSSTSGSRRAREPSVRRLPQCGRRCDGRRPASCKPCPCPSHPRQLGGSATAVRERLGAWTAK